MKIAVQLIQVMKKKGNQGNQVCYNWHKQKRVQIKVTLENRSFGTLKQERRDWPKKNNAQRTLEHSP